MKKLRVKRLFRRLTIAFIFALFIILTILISVNALRINEIMFNPQGPDAGREWVELYSEDPGCIDLSTYKFFESGTNHNIIKYMNITGERCEYYIICDNCSSLLDEYPVLPENISNSSFFKSSFSLSNTGEPISLKLNGSTIDEIDYSDYASGAIEGYSLEFFNDTFYNSANMFGTPGFINGIELLYVINTTMNNTINITINTTINNTINITINATINETINNTINITINETINNTINITINTTINTTINVTINTTINISGNTTKNCYVHINVTMKNSSAVYLNKESLKFFNKIRINDIENSSNFSNSTFLDPPGYSIEYWIEDLFGNIVKNKLITENSNEKSYTPNIDEGDRVLLIKNQVSNISCNISSNSIFSSSHMIIIKNPEYTGCKNNNQGGSGGGSNGGSSDGSSSSDSIGSAICADPVNRIYPGNISKFSSNESYILIDSAYALNSSIITSIHIHKGDTRKYVIEAFVIDEHNKSVSEHYKFRMNEKFSDIQNTIEMRLIKDFSCNYSLILIGLGLKEIKRIDCEYDVGSEEFSIDQDIEFYAVDQSNNETSVNFSAQAMPRASRISGNAVYESPNQRSRMYSLIGIIILFLAGTIIFMHKKMRISNDEKDKIQNKSLYEKGDHKKNVESASPQSKD